MQLNYVQLVLLGNCDLRNESKVVFVNNAFKSVRMAVFCNQAYHTTSIVSILNILLVLNSLSLCLIASYKNNNWLRSEELAM